MHKINPDDLDAIFRDGAEGHEYTYNEAAWNQMAAKLDRKNRNRRLWLLFSVGAIIIAAAVVWMLNTEPSRTPSDQAVSTDAPSKNVKLSTPNLSKANIEVAEAEINTRSKGIEDKKELNSTRTQINNNTSNLVSYENKLTSQVTDKVVEPSNDRTPTSYATNTTSSQNQSSSSKRMLSNLIQVNSSPVDISNEKKVKPLTNHNTAILLNSSRDLEYLDQLIQTIGAFDEEKRSDFTAGILDISPRAEVQKVRKQFVIGLQAGPEWSSVGLGNAAKLGWKVGLTAGVPVSDYFEVSVGAGVSRKVYGSTGSEFDMTGGWVDNIQPMFMESKCYIVDIPFNLSYYPHGRLADGFYAEVGISSYFFSSEWYGFTYDPTDKALVIANGNEPIEDVLVPEVNRNIASVGNLAIGYQKRLSDGTQLQLTPYVQLPFSGIGSGKVNLVTTGVRMAVRFNN